jgi:light-regulated signal transduction histidine kinase (bacteriophytochrome)
LSSIDGFSALLEKSITPGGGISEANLHQLSRIRRGIKQMGEMTDGLLSLAQVSRSAVRHDLVDLSSIASAILGQLQERDADRVASISVQPDVVVRGDGALMRQVLENLLANAWKFTSKEPRALISFQETVSPTGDLIYVVQDNGVGFDMAYADKLFGTFQRLHSPGEFVGTGIGLATARRIISRHRGEIWAQSEPGQGSRFYFSLGTEVQSADS